MGRETNSIVTRIGGRLVAPTAPTDGQALVYDATGKKWQPGTVGGSGGDSTTTAAYASRPSPSNDGNLFLPSDGFKVERDTGATWAQWGPLFPLVTPPSSAGFAWINQGTASVAEAKGGIFLSEGTGQGTSVNLRVRKKAAPSAPYSITTAFLPTILAANFTVAGFCWRDSGGGKLISLGFYLTSTGLLGLGVTKWNSATSFNAAPFASALLPAAPLVFFKAADDNTDLIASVSMDGQNWVEIWREARTTFLTPDEVGFFVTAALPGGVNLLHWLVG